MRTVDLLSHPKYRPDIDGLRAVAVVLVVLYHAFPTTTPGGFIGVDIFFVISGYLISTIIIDNISAGTFEFRTFYARRINRIFPALLVVLAACLVLGWFLLLPSSYKQLGRHTLGGATFVSNFILWHESGYFDISSRLKPLLHLWSLGVEEQFYLVWPIALWLAYRARISRRALIWVVIVSSFIFNVAIANTHPAADFYSPVTRFWELMLGCALADASISRRKPFKGGRHLAAAVADTVPEGSGHSRRCGIANLKAIAGTLLVLCAAFSCDDQMHFPGWIALLPSLGACLLISAGPKALINLKILSRPEFIFIGIISYPLYLWHWPLLSFARIFETGEPSAVIRWVLVILSVVLAWATYRFVERPIRFGNRRLSVTAALAYSLALAGCAGFAVDVTNGVPSRINESARRYVNFPAEGGEGGRINTCWLTQDHPARTYAADCVDARSATGRPLVLVWGDSHAGRFLMGLRAVASDRLRFAQYTRDSCPPFLSYPGLYQTCVDANAFILARAKALKPDVVILFGYWQLYAVSSASAATIAESIVETISALKAEGVAHVVVMGPAPRWNSALPDNLVRISLAQRSDAPPARTMEGLDKMTSKLDADLRSRIGFRPGVLYFSVYDALCDSRGCMTRVGDDLNALTSLDYGHLAKPGAMYVARKLLHATGYFDASETSAGEKRADRIFRSSDVGQQ